MLCFNFILSVFGPIDNFARDLFCIFWSIMFQNVNKKMPSTSRPRVSGSGTAGRISTNTPMSERQQMALLMQMTSNANQPGKLHFINRFFQNCFFR